MKINQQVFIVLTTTPKNGNVTTVEVAPRRVVSWRKKQDWVAVAKATPGGFVLEFWIKGDVFTTIGAACSKQQRIVGEIQAGGGAAAARPSEEKISV